MIDPIVARSRGVLERLLPANFVASARREPRDRFDTAWGHTCFLLFPLGADLQELADGLAERAIFDADAGALRPAFEVTLGTQRAISASEVERLDKPRSIPPSPRVDLPLLVERLEARAHFAVPLHKRARPGMPDTGRLTVGRGGTNDIVLKHPSVSKVHAWFEIDEFGTFYVGDAGSKNGTKVNGELRRAHELTTLVPGDTVRFGAVEALLCPPDALGELLHA